MNNLGMRAFKDNSFKTWENFKITLEIISPEYHIKIYDFRLKRVWPWTE